MMTITYANFKLACKDYQVEILKEDLQRGAFVVKAGVERIHDEVSDADFSPFLSLCAYLCCSQASLKLLDWILSPSQAYKVEVQL